MISAGLAGWKSLNQRRDLGKAALGSAVGMELLSFSGSVRLAWCWQGHVMAADSFILKRLNL